MKALIIEDDRSIVNAVQVAFEFRWPEADLVSGATARQGVELVRRESPDIVLLDLNLPDMSGYDALREIRTFSQVPVIILTVRAEDEDMLKGLEYGADDYITKPFNYLNLLARIKAVLRRVETIPYTGEHENEVGARLKIDFVSQKVKIDNRPVKLTPSEYHLLALLVRNRGAIVPYDRIIREVWDREYTGSNEGIRIYVRRLRDKLGDNPPSLILNKRGQGYLFKA